MFRRLCAFDKSGLTVFAGACLLLGVFSLFPSSLAAEEFLGVEIDRFDRTYVVTRDVNVREKPDTKSKRIAGLKKGERIQVAGRHQGWMAILKDGKPFGFTYYKYLTPLIDGTLEKPVRNSASIDGDGKCAYEIVFTGRSDAGIEEFSMADYEVQVQCDRGGETLAFVLYMFMTEGAYHPARPNVHQIGIDLLEISNDGGYDEIFTTNVLYNSDKGRADFSEITLKPYAGKPDKGEADVQSVGEALREAVRMALESWNKRAWDDLTKALKGE